MTGVKPWHCKKEEDKGSKVLQNKKKDAKCIKREAKCFKKQMQSASSLKQIKKGKRNLICPETKMLETQQDRHKALYQKPL